MVASRAVLKLVVSKKATEAASESEQAAVSLAPFIAIDDPPPCNESCAPIAAATTRPTTAARSCTMTALPRANNPRPTTTRNYHYLIVPWGPQRAGRRRRVVLNLELPPSHLWCVDRDPYRYTSIPEETRKEEPPRAAGRATGNSQSRSTRVRRTESVLGVGGGAMRSILLLSLSTVAALRHSTHGLPRHTSRMRMMWMLAGDEASVDELSRCTVVELKEKLRSRGLPVSGRKAELIARLSSSYAPSPRNHPAPSPPTAQGAPVLPSGFGLAGGTTAEFPTIEIEACKS